MTPFAARSNEKAWNVRIVEPRCVARLKEWRRRRWFGEGRRRMGRDEEGVVVHGFDWFSWSFWQANAKLLVFELGGPHVRLRGWLSAIAEGSCHRVVSPTPIPPRLQSPEGMSVVSGIWSTCSTTTRKACHRNHCNIKK